MKQVMAAQRVKEQNDAAYIEELKQTEIKR